MRRENNPRFKQSYVDYVNFLVPKIWENPDVRLSKGIREILSHREAFFLTKDIKDTESKIRNLTIRMQYLQQRSIKGVINKEEISELSRITGTIQKCNNWINDLSGFRFQLLQVYPYRTLENYK